MDLFCYYPLCVAAGGSDPPGFQQQRYGSSEIVEEENEKMASVLADKVKALNSVSYIASSLASIYEVMISTFFGCQMYFLWFYAFGLLFF